MKIKMPLAKREVGGDCFLVPLGKTVYNHNGIFVLTELGSFIWDILPLADSADYIVDKILEEYDVDRETAEKDTSAFLDKLSDMGII